MKDLLVTSKCLGVMAFCAAAIAPVIANDTVKFAQETLVELGQDPGPIDGA